MSRTVDARGLACPQPVILTKRAMDENSTEEIITLVDNLTARENVSKLAASQGYICQVVEQGNEYHIHLSKESCSCCDSLTAPPEIAILVKSNFLGDGSEELGNVLMKSFLYTLSEAEFPIGHIVFLNSGVRLTAEGSPVLEHLQALEQKGVKILSCGTCLDFYNLKDKLQVGQVTNMYTIFETLANAPKSLIF